MQHELLTAEKYRLLASVSHPISGGVAEKNESEVLLYKVRSGLRNKLPAFVINLDRRVDRWRRIVLMAARSGIVAIRVSAIDGLRMSGSSFSSETSVPSQAADYYHNSGSSVVPLAEVTAFWNSTFNAQFDKKCDPNLTTPMTLSERACAASHLKVWRMIYSLRAAKPSSSSSKQSSTYCRGNDSLLRNVGDLFRSVWMDKREYFVIFEDDASILSRSMFDFREKVENLLLNVPEDMDIMYLGAVVPTGAIVKKYRVRGSLFSKICYAWQLHAYVVTHGAVEKLLKHLPINAPVDNFVAALIHSGVLNAYIPEKPFVGQHGGTFVARVASSDIRHSGRAGSA